MVSQKLDMSQDNEGSEFNVEEFRNAILKEMRGVVREEMKNLVRPEGSLPQERGEGEGEDDELNSSGPVLTPFLVPTFPDPGPNKIWRSESNKHRFKTLAEIGGKLLKIQTDYYGKADENSAFVADWNSIMDLVRMDLKKILMAEESPAGWGMVEKYEKNPLADNAEDEKRMKKAEKDALATQKQRKNKPSFLGRGAGRAPMQAVQRGGSFHPSFRHHPYSTSGANYREKVYVGRDTCKECGERGHWKVSCPRKGMANPSSTGSGPGA